MQNRPRHSTWTAYLVAAAILGCITLLSMPAAAQSALAEADSGEGAVEEEQQPQSDEQASPDSEAADQAEAAETAEDPALQPNTDDGVAEDTSSSTPKSDEEYFGQAHRKRMYEQSKLSPTKALLYTLAFPGVGNIYAEQYFLAGLAFSLMAFTTMFVLYGLTTQQPQFLHMGLVTGGVAYVGGGVSSHFGVRKYNKRLREGFNLEQASSASPFDIPKVRTIGVTIRF